MVHGTQKKIRAIIFTMKKRREKKRKNDTIIMVQLENDKLYNKYCYTIEVTYLCIMQIHSRVYSYHFVLIFSHISLDAFPNDSPNFKSYQ